MIKRLSYFILLILISGCGPIIMKTYKHDNDGISSDCGLSLVKVHPPDSVVEKIGEIEIDDIGVSLDCSERKIIDYIKKEACAKGAQVVLIKRRKRPDDESFCFRCTAVLYTYKSGALPVKSSNYFADDQIKKRDRKDMRKKISRTSRVIAFFRRIFNSPEKSHNILNLL
jgi:hypothetical protein